jgi:WD40 repeat protein
VWEKLEDENLGWDSRLLQRHTNIVQAIAFQPGSLLLASVAADGWLCLWQKAKRMAQLIDDTTDISCLAWHPQGQKLAAGSQTGELLLWSQVLRRTGFGRGK